MEYRKNTAANEHENGKEGNIVKAKNIFVYYLSYRLSQEEEHAVNRTLATTFTLTTKAINSKENKTKMYVPISPTKTQNRVKLSVRIWKSYGFVRFFHCQ